MTSWADPLETIAGGVLWIDGDTDAAAMLADLGERWTTAQVSVDVDANKESMIGAIGAALDFPEWAGRNLDALYDLLTDLSWLDEEGHVAIAIERTMAARLGAVDGWQQIVQVLLDAAAWWQPEARVFVAILR